MILVQPVGEGILLPAACVQTPGNVISQPERVVWSVDWRRVRSTGACSVVSQLERVVSQPGTCSVIRRLERVFSNWSVCAPNSNQTRSRKQWVPTLDFTVLRLNCCLALSFELLNPYWLSYWVLLSLFSFLPKLSDIAIVFWPATTDLTSPQRVKTKQVPVFTRTTICAVQLNLVR